LTPAVGGGCLVRQTPNEGLFHWVSSLCIALRLQEGEPKQAVCEQKTEDPMLPAAQSLQLLTVPAEQTMVTAYSANSSCAMVHTAQREGVV